MPSAGSKANLYQMATYFSGSEGAWTPDVLLDNTTHPKAMREQRLVEISDNFVDSSGAYHVLLADHAGEEWIHFTRPADCSEWTKRPVTGAWDRDVNWLRLVEIEGSRYYVAASWDRLWVATDGGTVWTWGHGSAAGLRASTST